MNNESIIITIIIPCLNAADTIEKTLQSLRNQTSKKFECIVMDGNSKDGTQNIIENYRDVVTKFISEKDESGAAATNKAINMASGKFVCFLYADDYFVDSAVENIINEYFQNKEVDYISYGLQVQSLNSSKVYLKSFSKKNLKASLNNACFKHVLNHAYKKSLFEDIGYLKPLYFDGNIFYSNDREFLIRLCLNDKKNSVIEKILYIMQKHQNSFTGSRKNIVRIRYEHIGIANFYLENHYLLDSNKKTLKLFKIHNLSLLFTWYLITLSLFKCIKIFKIGYKESGILWIYYIFSRPLKEIFYRISVMN